VAVAQIFLVAFGLGGGCILAELMLAPLADPSDRAPSGQALVATGQATGAPIHLPWEHRPPRLRPAIAAAIGYGSA
jgi:uncharacterized membrane protein YfcA